jgi:hypothetical protein
MIFTWLFIILGVGIALLAGGEVTKDKFVGGALRIVGVLVIIFALVSLIGCHMITSGMRIE